MARVPILRKLYSEDFPTQKPWIHKLLSPVNDFMRVVSESFNHQLTIADNLDGFTITTECIHLYPIKIGNKLSKEPFAVFIGKVYNKTDSTISTSAITPYWTYDATAKTINIDNISGLNTAKAYDINFVILGG